MGGSARPWKYGEGLGTWNPGGERERPQALSPAHMHPAQTGQRSLGVDLPGNNSSRCRRPEILEAPAHAQSQGRLKDLEGRARYSTREISSRVATEGKEQLTIITGHHVGSQVLMYCLGRGSGIRRNRPRVRRAEEDTPSKQTRASLAHTPRTAPTRTIHGYWVVQTS